MEPQESVHPQTRAEWRAWLAANHDRSLGVWFVFWKQGSGRRGVSYEEAVQEALCFGWIDGQLRPIDAERSSIRFSPRRRGGNWAKSNKERVAGLEAAGLMTEAGRRAIERAKADGSWTALDDVEAMVVPDDLVTALEQSPEATERFETLSASVRKMILGYVGQAKRPATRTERIERAVRVLADGGPVTSIFRAEGRRGPG
jgi:uncharacterized protein YdeI (YjbR/CyaY-like superfamily)